MDYEDYFKKIADLIKTNLDAEIDAMNLKKTDLKIIKPQAWYEESFQGNPCRSDGERSQS